MAQFSFSWPETSGPVVGDGRKITAEEWATLPLWMFGSGVVPLGNMLAVTTPGANQISVNTGAAVVRGRFFTNSAAVALAPASAGGGLTRQDSVILECDWDGSGTTGQYTVRVITKQGTAGAPPALTQTINVRWQDRLYNYVINDAGAISAITDVRAYTYFSTKVALAMLDDGILSADAPGRAKMAAGFLGAEATSRAFFAADFFDAATVLAKFGVDSFNNANLLRLILNGAFQNDAASRALFADAIWTRAKLADGLACSVIGRGANSAGVPADLAAATNGHVLRREANVVGFGTIDEDSITAATDLQAKGVNVDMVDGLHAADIISGGVILGAILMWSGTLGGAGSHHPMVGGVANTDWHICNGDVVGSVTTPDLRDRFVVGAGSTYVKGATGGATTSSHTHTAGTLAADAHHHHLTDSGLYVSGGAPVTLYSDPTGIASADGVSGSTAASAPTNLPPYYGLYYIMKVA